MPQVEQVAIAKPMEKYLVIRKLGKDVEVLCETSNFNSAASFHLRNAAPGNGVHLLKNVEYSFTAREAGK